MVVISIILAIYGIEAIRYQRRASLIAEYRYILFGMRDRLRAIVARDQAARRSWVFAYLDSTTAKAISMLPILSVWRLIALATVYRKDKSYRVLSTNLERELAKPQFRQLKAYEEELTNTLSAYLSQRHNAFHLAVETVDHVVTPAKKVVEDMRKLSLDVAIKSPEMSTLPQHDPAFAHVVTCPA